MPSPASITGAGRGAGMRCGSVEAPTAPCLVCAEPAQRAPATNLVLGGQVRPRPPAARGVEQTRLKVADKPVSWSKRRAPSSSASTSGAGSGKAPCCGRGLRAVPPSLGSPQQRWWLTLRGKPTAPSRARTRLVTPQRGGSGRLVPAGAMYAPSGINCILSPVLAQGAADLRANNMPSADKIN